MIDPITCLTNQMGSAEANEELVRLTAELSAMAKDHNFTAYLFCHLKAPGDGLPHERGGKILSTQFAGSRAMMRSCNYMMGLRGNKDPELPVFERNMRYLDLLEDREFGTSGTVPLYWDENTGLFNEA
jgi:twinkle protein